MPTLYDLKPRFQSLLRPGVVKLARAGVTANQVTGLALALCIAVGVALYLAPGSRGALLLVAPVLLVRMALNAVDGMLAREHGQASRFGFFFNELADVTGDAALYLPLAAALAPFGVSPAAVVAFAFTAAVSEFAGVLGAAAGASRRYDGPLGKSDRAFATGAISLWVAAGFGGTALIGPLFAILALLGLWTTANRVRAALGEAEAAR